MSGTINAQPPICDCGECQAEDRRPLQGIDGTVQFALPAIEPAKLKRRKRANG